MLLIEDTLQRQEVFRGIGEYQKRVETGRFNQVAQIAEVTAAQIARRDSMIGHVLYNAQGYVEQAYAIAKNLNVVG